MKVLHVYKDYAPVIGGIENHIGLLAAQQARRGLDVTVLVAHPEPRTGPSWLGLGGATIERDGDVRVIRAARLATAASTPIAPAFIAWMRRTPTDVLHLHAPHPPGEIGVLFAKRRATVLSHHSDIVRQRVLGRLYHPLQQRLLRRIDRILVDSPRYADSSPELRAHTERCRVAPLGIDPTPWLEPDRRAVDEERARFGERLVLFIGKLRYYKGLDQLIAAMAGVDGTLVVAGVGPKGEEWRRLGSATLGQRCVFLGEISNDRLAALLAAASMLVLPSVERSEGFGLVLLEAMAAGVPVISTELQTGTSWVNQDGVTGLVVPPRNPDALRAAIGSLLDDRGRRLALGEAGRRRVLAEFTAERMTDRVLEIYAEALARPPAD